MQKFKQQFQQSEKKGIICWNRLIIRLSIQDQKCKSVNVMIMLKVGKIVLSLQRFHFKREKLAPSLCLFPMAAS